MAVDIGLIFSALGVAKSIAEFAGVLDSIEAKVERLVQSELNAGLRTLEQAGHATSEQVPLLREARASFNKAVGLETGYRRAVALLGLSLCHHWLDDKPNCMRALEEILAINPVPRLGIAIAAGRGVAIASFKDILSPKPWLGRDQTIKRATSIFLSSGMLTVFSSRARKEYKRRVILDAVNMSAEAAATRRIQESVSRHVGKPVSWLNALE